jgi:hypothetical protein
VGKTRLELAPMINHWWQVTMAVTARGLTTGAIPYESSEFDVEFDLVSHELSIRSSNGKSERLALESGNVADFHARYFAALRRLGIDVSIQPMAVEMPETVRLDSDTTFREYDRDWATRYFHALHTVNHVFWEFRSSFLGKVSPVHFYWGSFDLAVTRFSGRRAPPHPGGVPHCPDYVMREAYSHEVSSAGFWPGDARFPQAAFYSYVYPEPPGFRRADVPDGASYNEGLGEFVLPYAHVRAAHSPERELLAFLDATYDAAADLGSWDRAALERPRLVTEAESEPETEEVDDRDLRTRQRGGQAQARGGAQQ